MMALNRFTATLAGCLLTTASCLIPANLPRQPERCGQFELPPTLGTWQLLKQDVLPDDDLAIFDATQHWRRTYQCIETKQVIVATMIAGATGPLASHQPDICYARKDYRAIGGQVTHRASLNQADEFQYQTFESRTAGCSALTVAYAWHDGQRWCVPIIPRIQLAGCASLRRLQVTVAHPSGTSLAAQQTLQQFVKLAVGRQESSNSPSVAAASERQRKGGTDG